MSKVYTAPFPQTTKTATAIATTAGTYVDDAPTNSVLLMSAGTDGCLVTKLRAIARATNSASVLNIFLSKDGGTTKRLIESKAAPAGTISTSSVAMPVAFDPTELSPLRLEANDQLWVNTSVLLTQGWVFKAEFTNY